ncbi:hypothetical protein ABKT17_14240 [Enterobacter hormaechei]
MIAYVYLESLKFVDTWVNGGSLPIRSVLEYKCKEEGREGNLTPDEGVIDTSTHAQNLFGISAEDSSITIGKFLVAGKVVASNIKIERFSETGIVLCAAARLDRKIAEGFKRNYCVRINDFDSLKSVIDTQLGVVGKLGYCYYTTGHKRNTFLKSYKDSWQNEIRIFWKDLSPTEVILPKGLAIQIDVP